MHKKHKRTLVLSLTMIWLCAVLLVTIVNGNPVTAIKRAVTDAKTAKESAEAVRISMELSATSSSNASRTDTNDSHGAATQSSQSSMTVSRSSKAAQTQKMSTDEASSAAIPASSNEQLTALTEAAMNGNVEAQFTMGEVSMAAKTADAAIIAYAWYALASEQGHLEATQKADAARQAMSENSLAEADRRFSQLQKAVESRQEPVSAVLARDEKRKIDVLNIRNALLIHKSKHGAYPTGLPADHSLPICPQNTDCSGGADLSTLVTDGLLTEIPSDPKAETGTTGYILRGRAGEFFVIAANMERSDAIQAGTRN